MNVLITGASGFIGGRLAKALVSHGMQLHAVVRPSSSIQPLENMMLHVYDGSYASLERVCAEHPIDCAFHIAGSIALPYDPADIDSMLEGNIRLGSLLAEALVQHGCRRFIHTGTYWQHNRDATYTPNSFYAASKKAMEDILAYYALHRNLSVITLKLGDVYGEHDPRQKLFHFLKKARTEQKPLAMTAGEQQLPIVHVDDVVAAYLQAQAYITTLPPGSTATYHVTGKPVRLRDLVTQYMRMVPDPVDIHWDAMPYRPGQIMEPFAGTALPGWQPMTTLQTGMKRIITNGG